MIPYDISDASILFIARGKSWSLAVDHANFRAVRELLRAGEDDEDKLIHLVDIKTAVQDATDGRAQITESSLIVDGEAMPEAWRLKAIQAPEATKVLLVHEGDRVRVEGDEDAPDGIYTVGSVDNDDVSKRVYVESEDDYFGFVANTSIKEILQPEA
jgi:hypothetical protein